jgi:hypothetical protein
VGVGVANADTHPLRSNPSMSNELIEFLNMG